MKALLINLWLAFMVPEQGCLKIDIILLGDLSGSVDDKEYFVANVFGAFVDRFELDSNTVKIGVMVFESEPYILSHLTDNKGQLLTSINYIRNNDLSGTTQLGKAIKVAWNEFTLYGRADARKMLIIVSDGGVDSKKDTSSLIKQMKVQTDIEVCGIYIDTYSGDSDYMMDISDQYCYVSTGYNLLVQELERLDLCL